jgi:murein DD-endopeptidase MepM/ murein hydrolase activator NlpD
MSEQKYGPLADQYARKYGVPPKLFRLLISAESSWNPNAGSSAGAKGLTQVVPKWHPKANLSTPQGQLDYGAKHLGSLLKKYGNPRDALAVYNSGKPWKVSQAYGETNAYVKKILGAYASDSGGAAPPDAGGEPPALPASIPGGQLDTKALMNLLKATRQRVLSGQMPGGDYQQKLMGLAQQALPRAQAYVGAKNVGTAAVGAAQATVPAFGGFKMGGGPEGHGQRALGNWQSDNAYDLMGKAGDPVPAFTEGVVVKISGKPGGDPGFAGYGITVRTPQGDLFYKHLGTANVKVGQRITPQTILGTLDAKTAGGPHLHLGGTNRKLIDALAKTYTRRA